MKFKALKQAAATAIAAALALSLTACGDVDNPPGPKAMAIADEAEALGSGEVRAEMERLYKAAKDAGEDSVTLYGAGENDRGPVYDVFMQRYPEFEVTGHHLTGPDFNSKLANEFASGNHVGDLVQGGDTSVAKHIEEGKYVPFKPVSITELDPRWTEPTGTVWSAAALPFGIAYNTNAVSEDEAPKTWNDLTDQAWKGRIVMDNPTVAGSSLSEFRSLLADERYGEEYLETMANQEPNNVDGSTTSGAAVSSGEFDVAGYYPYAFYLREKDKGAPIEFNFPTEDGSYLSGHYLGLIKGAPNPNAAKLLMTWLFTPEGQQALAAVGYYPTTPGSPGPGDFPSISELDLIAATPLSEVEAETERALAKIQAVWPR